MIFSKQKWEIDREGLDYLKISNACSWNTVKAPLRNAYDLFIAPLIGEAMSETLTGIYLQDERDERDTKLLNIAQRANILLAFWYDYAELNVLIGDSGFKRMESDEVKTPYKYQEKQLRDGWKTKGFNALDDLLRYLEKNVDNYADYKLSENYTLSRNAIIQNTGQVNEIYFINHSRLTFLRLKPHFKIVEETILAPRMGELYKMLKNALRSIEPEEEYNQIFDTTFPPSNDPRVKYVYLRKVLRPVVVYYAVSRLLLETGDLSDKGLFFASLRGDDSDTDVRPVSNDRIVHQANRADADAVSYWKLAEKHIRKNFGIEPATGGFPRRDNRGRKAFFA